MNKTTSVLPGFLGHAEVHGSEVADYLAKSESKSKMHDPEPFTTVSYASCASTVNLVAPTNTNIWQKNTQKVFSSQMVIHNQTLVKFGNIIINYHIWKCCKYATLGLTGCNEGLQYKKKKTKFIPTKTNDFNANRICKYHVTKLLFISYTKRI